LAGLFPAEVLALHAMCLTATVAKTSTEPGAESTSGQIAEPAAVITHPTTLKWAFWGLVALCAIEFLGTRIYTTRKARKNLLHWELLYVLVPVVSFVAWTMVQPATAFDAAFPEVEEAARVVIGYLLGAVAIFVVALTRPTAKAK